MLVAVLLRFTNFTDDLLTHSTGTISTCLGFAFCVRFKEFNNICVFLFMHENDASYVFKAIFYIFVQQLMLCRFILSNGFV